MKAASHKTHLLMNMEYTEQVPEGYVVIDKALAEAMIEDTILPKYYAQVIKAKGPDNEPTFYTPELSKDETRYAELVQTLANNHIEITRQSVEEAAKHGEERYDFVEKLGPYYNMIQDNSKGDLEGLIANIYMAGKDVGFSDSKIDSFFSPADFQAMAYANDYNFNLIQNVSDDMRRAIGDEVFAAKMRGDSMPELAKRIEDLGIEPIRAGGRMLSVEERAMLIARTETCRAGMEGNLIALQQLDINLFDWSDSGGDDRECDDCAANAEGGPYTIDTLPEYPAHPDDRCAIIPAANQDIRDGPIGSDTGPIDLTDILNIYTGEMEEVTNSAISEVMNLDETMFETGEVSQEEMKAAILERGNVATGEDILKLNPVPKFKDEQLITHFGNGMNNPALIEDTKGVKWVAKGVTLEEGRNEIVGSVIEKQLGMAQPDGITLVKGLELSRTNSVITEAVIESAAETTDVEKNIVMLTQFVENNQLAFEYKLDKMLSNEAFYYAFEDDINKSIVKDVLIRNTDGHFGNYIIGAVEDEERLIPLDNSLSGDRELTDQFTPDVRNSALKEMTDRVFNYDIALPESGDIEAEKELENYIENTFGEHIDRVRELDIEKLPQSRQAYIQDRLDRLPELIKETMINYGNDTYRV